MNTVPWKHAAIITFFKFVPTCITCAILGTIWFTSITLIWLNYLFFIPPFLIIGLSYIGFIIFFYFIFRYFLRWSLNRQYRHFSIQYKKDVDYRDIILISLWPTLLGLGIVMFTVFVVQATEYFNEDGLSAFFPDLLNFLISFILVCIFTKIFLKKRSQYIDYKPHM